MPIRFTLRTVLLATFAFGLLLGFLTPVVRITPGTAAQIEPGMTIPEASRVIGAEPGRYDGVVLYTTTAPPENFVKGENYRREWTGLRGEIVAILNRDLTIQSANYYPIWIRDWSFSDFFWERFLRVQYSNISIQQRAALLFGLVAAIAWLIGMLLLPKIEGNFAAKHGLIGLILGPIAGLALFLDLANGHSRWTEHFEEEWSTVVLVCSPLLGAAAGLAAAACRCGAQRLILIVQRLFARRMDEPALVNPGR